MNKPTIDVDSYDTVVDDVNAAPKHGTTIQSGWGAAASALKPQKASGEYPTDFRVTDQAQLVRFLEDEPFAVYELHWVEREGKKSFVCSGDECPLCTIAGDKPRAKFAFNVLVLSDETPTVQILTAPITFARQLQAANEDPRRGPLTKYYWAISRQGTGQQTQYTLDRVRATDLAEEWELDSDEIDALASKSVSYDKSAIYVSPDEELLKVAKQMITLN
jgi:hypothetical protein